MRSWPRGWPAASSAGDRWRRPNGTWPSPPGHWLGAPGAARPRAGRPRRHAHAACPPARRPPGRGREAQRLLAPAGPPTRPAAGSGEDLRALALINLGIAEAVDRSLRGGGAASGAGRRPGPADRAALPGGHRPGALGAAGQLAILPAGGAAQHAGHRAGRAARLGRGAGRRGRLSGARHRAGRPGPARGGRAVARAGRAHPAGRDRTGGRDAAPLRSRAAGADQRPSRSRADRVPGRRTAGRAARHRAHAGQPAALAHAADARAAGPRRSASNRPWPGWANRSATAGRCAMPWRCSRLAQDDPKAATAALAARPRRLCAAGATPTSGRFRPSCSRRSPATRSATRPPPGAPWSAPSTWPRRKACCSRSCSTPRRGCSTGTVGSAQRTPR